MTPPLPVHVCCQLVLVSPRPQQRVLMLVSVHVDTGDQVSSQPG